MKPRDIDMSTDPEFIHVDTAVERLTAMGYAVLVLPHAVLFTKPSFRGRLSIFKNDLVDGRKLVEVGE